MMRVLQPSLLLTLVGIASGLPAGRVDGRSSSAIPDINQTAALEALGKTAADFRLPGSLPNPDYEAGTDMLPGIEYIVMLMMENHSFDNIWGTLDREDVDGFTLDSDGNPIETQEYANGTVQHLYVMPNTCNSDNNGPTQNWLSSHEQYDNGSMDGFVVGGGYKPISMGYYTEEQLPFTHSLGQTFPISDRFFCSLLGQTWPNRMYLMAGTSMGIVDTDQWSALIQVPPSGTIFDTLDNYDIGWVNYVSEESTLDLYPISDLGPQIFHTKTFNDFFSDAAAGALPSFSFLDENYETQSQESPQNVVVGEALMYDVVQAIGSSPNWDKTLLIINYDEHGGYYDHVTPPVALAPDDVAPSVPEGEYEYEGFTRYGFRVPAVVVSPWAKKDYISHLVYDHTSILALLEYKWNLPALTLRDANANNMLDFIDLDALASGTMNFPDLESLSLSLPGNTTEALACSEDDPGVIPPVGSVSSALC